MRELVVEHEGVIAFEHLAASLRAIVKERRHESVRDYLERLERIDAPPLEPAD